MSYLTEGIIARRKAAGVLDGGSDRTLWHQGVKRILSSCVSRPITIAIGPPGRCDFSHTFLTACRISLLEPRSPTLRRLCDGPVDRRHHWVGSPHNELTRARVAADAALAFYATCLRSLLVPRAPQMP